MYLLKYTFLKGIGPCSNLGQSTNGTGACKDQWGLHRTMPSYNNRG